MPNKTKHYSFHYPIFFWHFLQLCITENCNGQSPAAPPPPAAEEKNLKCIIYKETSQKCMVCETALLGRTSEMCAERWFLWEGTGSFSSPSKWKKIMMICLFGCPVLCVTVSCPVYHYLMSCMSLYKCPVCHCLFFIHVLSYVLSVTDLISCVSLSHVLSITILCPVCHWYDILCVTVSCPVYHYFMSCMSLYKCPVCHCLFSIHVLSYVLSVTI